MPLLRTSRWALALALLLAQGAVAYAQDTIKIGVITDRTASAKFYAEPVTRGVELGAKLINQNGGVLGKKIELIVEDNKSNPTEAAATAEKLIVKDKVPVMLGAWGSGLTLAIMPKLEEYKVPMVVETSSSGKITTSGNPYIFRISPTSEMEAKAFTPLFKSLGIKKADFLSTNNDFGLGAAKEFSEAATAQGVQVGVRETMDPKATDFSAQLAKIKASGGDTVFVTTAVEQITLILKQAKDQQLGARIITTGGSNSPEQLIQQAGEAANGSLHLVFFTPWFTDAVKNPDVANKFVAAWNEKKYPVGGLTEGFRGWDGIHVIVEGIKAAGKADSEAITTALWGVKVKGINGDIAFIKQGPAGKESAQNVPAVYLVKIDGGKVTKQ
jgi:branched-chain amino acid transport system substrate-binding protein